MRDFFVCQFFSKPSSPCLETSRRSLLHGPKNRKHISIIYSNILTINPAKRFHLILTASMNNLQPIAIYEAEKKKYEEELRRLKKKQTLLGWLRLAIIIFAAVIAFYLFNYSLLWGWIAVVTGIGFFLAIVSVDIENNKKISHLKLLIQINQEEIDSLNGIFETKYSGIDLLPELHDYAYDFDVFGNLH